MASTNMIFQSSSRVHQHEVIFVVTYAYLQPLAIILYPSYVPIR